MKKCKKVYYYKKYTDDMVQSKKQNYKLKDNYLWVHNNVIYKFIASIVYRLMYVFGIVYCKCLFMLTIKNKKVLKQYKNTGFFIYGNHTQPIGDVFIPALACKSKRIFIVISPANLGIPFIGRILPMIGGLPIPENMKGMKLFKKAIDTRISEKRCVVIYPESHVWPYYTKVRPFTEGAFKFPVEYNVPAFAMTTIYKKRKYSNKPKAISYIDGPFFVDEKAKKDEKIGNLYNKIYECMKSRCDNESNYEYIEYKKID